MREGPLWVQATFPFLRASAWVAPLVHLAAGHQLVMAQQLVAAAPPDVGPRAAAQDVLVPEQPVWQLQAEVLLGEENLLRPRQIHHR
jgi:hypothetical protein